MRYIPFLLLLFLTNNALTQTTFKEGYAEISNDHNTHTDKGQLKLVPLTQYKIIKQSKSGSIQVRYKQANESIYPLQKEKGQILVKDNLWTNTNQQGELIDQYYYDKGVLLWHKSYSQAGNLIQHSYHSVQHDSSFYAHYENQRLVKKTIYSSLNLHRPTDIFYPNDNLEISDAELSFRVNFLYAPIDTIPIQLTAKNQDEIIQINNTSPNLKIVSKIDHREISSLDLKKGVRHELLIIYAPSPNSSKKREVIQFLGLQSYSLVIKTNAAHLDGWNINKVTEITLSKKRDQFLWIANMGTQTDAFMVLFTDDHEQDIIDEKHYSINNKQAIDLAFLKKGTYHLSVLSCHTGGYTSIKVTE